MNASPSLPQRKVVGRLSIAAGNAIQMAGLLAGCAALALARAQARSLPSKGVAIASMIAAWILFYFFCHGIAHWVVGRIVGIRFAFYTVGGSSHPQNYPGLLRWIFEHLPFFGVQTEKASMQKASPMAKAVMWSAGVTSSAVVPTLGAVGAWRAGVAGSVPWLAFAVFWAIGTLSSNWRSPTGDYSKARRALARG